MALDKELGRKHMCDYLQKGTNKIGQPHSHFGFIFELFFDTETNIAPQYKILRVETGKKYLNLKTCMQISNNIANFLQVR